MVHIYLSIALIPILMILEYYLRIVSVKLYNQKYGQHIVIKNYPNQITMSVKYFLFIILLTIFTWFFLNYDIPIFAKEVWLGAILTIYSSNTGLNLFNLLSYFFVIKNPGEISGEAHISLNLGKKITANLFIFLLIPYSVTALYIQDPFIYGSILGILILYFFMDWLPSKYKIT